MRDWQRMAQRNQLAALLRRLNARYPRRGEHIAFRDRVRLNQPESLVLQKDFAPRDRVAHLYRLRRDIHHPRLSIRANMSESFHQTSFAPQKSTKVTK